ncbi:venom dipeptidyl peptidase 4 isoform X1 [Trichogramma pretiosum]|uniref:venom dipeptidyl peptidase 4 isoform X1 n=1 Tax=Trichogramma pretiosum TaxID=7493 RepID=UPI0006C95E36|nr:venom dipeptidyl peptidase 4 isoform X1 [Trichogramma pretiosum]
MTLRINWPWLKKNRLQVILASISVIILLCLIVTLSLVYGRSTDHGTTPKPSKRPYALDEVIATSFSGEGFNGTWISETEIFYRVDERLLKYDVASKTTEEIASDKIFDAVGNFRFILSPDKNYVLIRNISESVYRHSSLSIYHVYDLHNKTKKPLANGQLLSTAIWAPVGSSLAYVLKNDIYYQRISKWETRRVTFDGQLQEIYNGVPDWVYEEEVFGSDKTLWFAPNGEYLAFATFNDTQVPEAVILRYGNPGDLKNQYPTEDKFRYPKAGATNPDVTLNLIDLSDHGSTLKPLPTPVKVVGSEAILNAVRWLDNNRLIARWTNRVQNVSNLGIYSLNGQWSPLDAEKVPHGWVLFAQQAPILDKDHLLVLATRPGAESDRLGSFGHLLRYRLLDGVWDGEEDLTPGNMWVQAVHGVNDLKRVVYFTASPPNEPSQKHLYEVSLSKPRDSDPAPLCISCTIETPEGNNCTYVSVSFSTDFSHYALSCLGPDPATTRIFDYERKELHTWSANRLVRDMISKRLAPRVKDLYVESAGFNAKVRLLLPPDFDASNKYPMLVNVYAGPNSQRINDIFSVGFETYMTTSRRVIYAWIDGRGSSNKGTEMLYAVYRRLGSAELEDQINVTRKLQQKFDWIDSKRTAIWGWSYGGFSTASILTKDTGNVFKCGIAVAPVTNWIYYDSIYTERFMGLPTKEDNLQGYEDSSVMKRVERMRNKKFLLVHGTGDDNVHYQQSMALARSLEENDIMFEQVSYPDEAHALSHLLRHLYHTMDRFWGNCLGYEATKVN